MTSIFGVLVFMYVQLLTTLHGNGVWESTDIRDYCLTHVFTATCNEDEVVVMTSATYGRMRISPCVKVDYGNLGCRQDVLRITDHRCSGRQSCSIPVASDQFENTNPCPGELQNYLEAAYTCQIVATASPALCSSNTYVKLTAGSGYLSSAIAESSGCGTTASPWIVEADQGKIINLTLHDFTHDHMGTFQRNCRELFSIIEDRHVETVTNCGSTERSAMVYVSHSNSIQIQFATSFRNAGSNTEEDQPQFLIHYEAIGCRDPVVPPHSWMTRRGDTATIGCKASEVTWTVTCSQGSWVKGQRDPGVCTVPVISSSDKNWSGLPIPHELAIVIILLVALSIGIVILVVGLLYLRRRNYLARQARNESTYMTSQQSYPNSKPPDGAVNTTVTSYKGYDENEYSVIWELQQQQQQQRQQALGQHPPPLPPAANKPGFHGGEFQQQRSTDYTYPGQNQEEGPMYFDLDSTTGNAPQNVPPGYTAQR